MVSACKGGSAKSITGMSPVYVDKSPLILSCSCYALLSLLPSVQEEVTQRRYNRENGRKSSPCRRC